MSGAQAVSVISSPLLCDASGALKMLVGPWNETRPESSIVSRSEQDEAGVLSLLLSVLVDDLGDVEACSSLDSSSRTLASRRSV